MLHHIRVLPASYFCTATSPPVWKLCRRFQLKNVSASYHARINFARTRSFPGADIGSDHDLVMMTFHIHLQNVTKQKGTRLEFDLEKLKDPNIQKTFKSLIDGKFAPLTIMKETVEGEDLDTLTVTFSTAITDTAMEILGKHWPKKKQWITDDILEMCDKRRELQNRKHDAQGIRRPEYANTEK